MCVQVIDVTWRYSAKHDEVRKGRNLVSEEWLLQTVNRMTEEVKIIFFVQKKYIY